MGKFVNARFKRALKAGIFPDVGNNPPYRPAVVGVVRFIDNRFDDRLGEYVPG